MREELQALMTSVQSVIPHLDAVEELESRHSTAQANLDSVEASLASTQAKLKDANATLSTAQLEAKKKAEQAIHDSEQELKDLTNRTTKARSDLAELESQIRAKTTQHKQIEDSLASLRAKLG